MSAELPSHTKPANPVALTQGDRGELHDVFQVHAAILREKPDPKEGFEPLNLWMVVLIAGLLFWGGAYLTQYSGRFEADEFEEGQHGKTATMAAGGGTPVDPLITKGQTVFTICAGCHNDDGNGKDGVAPPLVGSDWVNADGPNRLARIVLFGLKGPVKVNDKVTFNVPGQAMTPFKDTLKDEEIAAALSFVRSSWGNKGGLVKPEQVAAIRKELESRPADDQWTPEDLLKIPTNGGTPAPGGGDLTPDQLKEKLKAMPADQLQKLIKELTAK